MQEEIASRPNAVRSAAMRDRLLAAARRLFVERGYADTGTPELVAAAGVTRGALYHHFADKRALFAALVEGEAAALAGEIESASARGDALRQLEDGARAYLAAMQVPGRTRLLLLDGPAVLGRAAMDAIDGRHGARTLREGLAAAMGSGMLQTLPLDSLASQLAAMFDRAALSIEGGASMQGEWSVLEAVLDGLSNEMTKKSGPKAAPS